jgi:hypothetical protein
MKIDKQVKLENNLKAQLKAGLDKEHGREFSWEEAEQAFHGLKKMAHIMYEGWKNHAQRQRKLKTSPTGFHLDQVGLNCCICHKLASMENSWYDSYGLKCMACQKAIDKKIIPKSVATKRESWYSKFDLEMYFNIKYKLLSKYIKEGILKDRIISDAKGKQHFQVFLIKDNKDVLPPKNLLRSRTIIVKRDGEDYYITEYWYEFIHERLARKLEKYGIVECFKESFSQPIDIGRFYHKVGKNPPPTHRY